MPLKITLDFNCIISLEKGENTSSAIYELIGIHDNGKIDISVPAISGNEKLPNGEYADNINAFISRIKKLSIREIEILKPMAMWDMCFWDYCLWSDDQMDELARKIHTILFPTFPYDWKEYSEKNHLDISKLTPQFRNKRCDVISLWCHIYYQHDIFITSDKNFLRKAKLESLHILGSKKILTPKDALDFLIPSLS